MGSAASSTYNLPSPLSCEIKIIKANHLEFIPPVTIFIRYYHLYAGTGKRVCLKSREVPSTCEPCWKQSFALQCHSDAKNAIDQGLRLQTILFELRWRSSALILGRIVGSKPLGRAEIAWKELLQSVYGSIERWIPITATSRALSGLERRPVLQVGLRVRGLEKLEMVKRRVFKLEKWNQCGCSDGGCNYRDAEIFAIAVALDVVA